LDAFVGRFDRAGALTGIVETLAPAEAFVSPAWQTALAASNSAPPKATAFRTGLRGDAWSMYGTPTAG
jgi:hypothetical protein